MTTTFAATATYRPSLFAVVLAVVMPAFYVLHDAQWRAPWDRA